MACTTKSSEPHFSRIARTVAVDRGDILDVAGHDEVGAELGGERLHALAKRLALVGEGEFRALCRKLLGDAPGDGMIVRDPHDEAALALHDASSWAAPIRYERWKTSVALVPPKPKELDRTVSILALSMRLRTIGTPSKFRIEFGYARFRR
jgi:hypothetical protein